MDQVPIIVTLVLVALAVLVNKGSGDRVHWGVQLYLTVLMLFCGLVAFGRF